MNHFNLEFIRINSDLTRMNQIESGWFLTDMELYFSVQIWNFNNIFLIQFV